MMIMMMMKMMTGVKVEVDEVNGCKGKRIEFAERMI